MASLKELLEKAERERKHRLDTPEPHLIRYTPLDALYNQWLDWWDNCRDRFIEGKGN